jgi:hypothetical protein
MSRGISPLRGVQIPGRFLTKFCMSLAPQYGMHILTPLWLIEIGGGSNIFGKFAHFWPLSSLPSAGDGGDWSASRLDRFHPLKNSGSPWVGAATPSHMVFVLSSSSPGM